MGKLEASGRTKDNTIQELMKRIEELVKEQQGHCKVGGWTNFSMIKDLEQEIEEGVKERNELKEEIKEGLTERLRLEQSVTILKVVEHKILSDKHD